MVIIIKDHSDDLTARKYNIKKGTATITVLIVTIASRLFLLCSESSECSLHTRLFVQSDRDCRQFCEDTADCRFYYWSPFSLFLEHFLVKDVAKNFKPREVGIFSMLLHMPTHYFCRKSRQKIVLQVPHRLLALPPLLLSLPQVLCLFCRKLFSSQIFELL